MAVALNTPYRLSDMDLAIAASMAEVPATPGSLMSGILQGQNSLSDADLSAIMAALGVEETHDGSNLEIRVERDRNGSAGFVFDRTSMKITSKKSGRANLNEMRTGDVIAAVNGSPVRDAADYNRLAQGVRSFRLSLRRTNNSSAPERQPRPARAARPLVEEYRAMALDVDAMSYEELLDFEARQGNVVEPGLSDAMINQLPVGSVCGGGGECGICLEDICDGEESMRLPCLHEFHPNCIRMWLKKQARCPFCNSDVQVKS